MIDQLIKVNTILQAKCVARLPISAIKLKVFDYNNGVIMRYILIVANLLLAFLLINIRPVSAQTVDEMRRACIVMVEKYVPPSSYSHNYESMYCLGYMAAVLHLYHVVDVETNKPLLSACVPTDISMAQLAQIFINSANVQPEIWNKDVRSVLLPALSKSFPCKVP